MIVAPFGRITVTACTRSVGLSVIFSPLIHMSIASLSAETLAFLNRFCLRCKIFRFLWAPYVGRTLLFDQNPPMGGQLHHAVDDFVQHRLQRFVGWLGHFDEFRGAARAAPVHTVQHQAVQVGVEIGG
jgi:hypothetical protein